MSDNNTNNAFASFMTPKDVEKQNSNSTSSYLNSKTKEALEKARNDEKEEQEKELKEAKKNSVALANRYNKSDMMKLQARNMIFMAPFIIIGIIFVILLIFKGGDWVSLGLNKVFKLMTNSK